MVDQPQTSDLTRERILGAARELFAAKGYARTTTRALAKAAGVSEVTIFRHFESKQNLFETLLQKHSGMPDIRRIFSGLNDLPCRDALRQIGAVLLTALLERKDTLRLMLCEAKQFPELRDLIVQIPQELRENTAAYLAGQIQLGRLRPADPTLMAQSFIGQFFSFAILTEILQENELEAYQHHQVIDHFVDLFYLGARTIPGKGTNDEFTRN